MKKQLLFGISLLGALALNGQTFKDATPASFVQGVDNHCSSAYGDLNGDGLPDIIVTGRENSSGLHKTWIYLNDGNGGFTLSENSNITMGLKFSSVSLGDYDDDGDLDIIMQGWDWNPDAKVDTQRAYVYKNDGSGVFTLAAELSGRSNGRIQFGDYDNDGLLDVLQTGWKDDRIVAGHGKTTLYHNDGNDTFSVVDIDLYNIADGEACFGDYDGDGNLDIIVAGWMNTIIYKGDGTGNFVNQNIDLPKYDWSYVDFVDYDKDGFLDILLGGHYTDNGERFATKVLKGDGTGNFTDLNLGLPNVQRGPVRLGDCNKDGKTDFFISGWGGDPNNGGLGGVFQIYVNDGTNNAFAPVDGINSLIGGWADGTMLVADFNGDGYDDIFKCGWEQTKLYINTTTPGTTGNDLSGADGFSVYVDNDILNINLASEAASSNVNIYDMTGKLVAQYSFAGQNGSLTLPQLDKGYYLVTIRNEAVNSSAIIGF